MKKKFYVKAAGVNRFVGGGTSNWLRIRKLEDRGDHYIITVKRAYWNNYNKLYVYDAHGDENLKFAAGWPDLQPISLRRVVNELL